MKLVYQEKIRFIVKMGSEKSEGCQVNLFFIDYE